MKKKLLATLLASCMLIGLFAACGSPPRSLPSLRKRPLPMQPPKHRQRIHRQRHPHRRHPLRKRRFRPHGLLTHWGMWTFL